MIILILAVLTAAIIFLVIAYVRLWARVTLAEKAIIIYDSMFTALSHVMTGFDYPDEEEKEKMQL